MSTRIAMLLATWFGCGLSPHAPGTVGSLAAVLIGIVLHLYAGFSAGDFLLLAVLVLPAAVWSAGVTSRALKVEDPQTVVIDEVLGQWVALAGARALTPAAWLAAFALFRLFDIWKPWPVRQLESLPAGWGINADDLMAGVYAALVLFAAGWFNLY
jgi:phosphatidylglycerophosphatase A